MAFSRALARGVTYIRFLAGGQRCSPLRRRKLTRALMHFDGRCVRMLITVRISVHATTEELWEEMQLSHSLRLSMPIKCIIGIKPYHNFCVHPIHDISDLDRYCH
jgi:hypothetical protein